MVVKLESLECSRTEELYKQHNLVLDENKNYRLQAERWIQNNPKAYSYFKRFAQEMMKKGRRFGINLLRERVRWECSSLSDHEFKFSNSYSPYVARWLIKEIPGLERFMDCKQTKW